MIETKPYNLTRKEYTKIVFKTRLKKFWWIFLIVFLAVVFHLKNFGKDNLSTFAVFFAVVYPIITFIWLYFWANSKGHNPIFSKIHLSFDNQFLYFSRNKNESKITPDSIQKTISNKRYWLLYIAKGQFIYVPKNIFYSNDDFIKFKELIKKQNGKNNSI